MEINDLTPAEERVWRAFPTGAPVDFREGTDEDTAEGARWGPERTVRAAVLRALLLNGPQDPGEIAALKVSGARITGPLDLRYGTSDFAVRLSHCHFDEIPQLYGARLRQLNLSNSVLPGLVAATMRVDGVLRLTDCRFGGQVRLGGAHITGALFMDRAECAAPDDSEGALHLNHVTIGDDLWAPGLRADGEVRLNSAEVAGSVRLNGARLNRPGGAALDGETLTVQGDVLMRQVHSDGWIGLRGARIAGRLELSHARLSNRGDTALRASSCTIGELWLRKGPPMDGALNLRRAQIEVLFLEPEMLPTEVFLGDLVYTSLTPHVPADHRLPMLERDGDGYVPHAYEQLSAAYRRVGDDHAARLVQLTKQRRLRRTRAWYGRLWGYVQDATVGYGFHPLRAAVWLLSLLAVGSLAYGLHHPPALKPSEAPHFNPVFYTLDLLLPVISFGQEEAFAPDGWYQYLAYALIITGWILATTVVTGVTRTVSRQ
ncbi:membrane-associated oxidoreductase [Streptomyces sp. NBC_00201]|uniref:membrane-associated oxidoreductase n=1 Tax=unclassified Streptomyces TaxID=2593676 RepID=UPI00225BCFD0|nr:membrane-associated oxidoreductase [Streptomyces sp. NBC_00201]MCX5250294.1 membrane-associated oxidoreductase [Streptomyces sp. NBC_00201]